MELFSTTEANKLYNIQINLEKSTNLVFDHLKKYSDYDVSEHSAELFKERQTEWKMLQTNVKYMLEPLRKKMKLIKDKTLSDITDFKQFKKEMIVIQENIQNLKSETKMKIEFLEKERSDISQDLDFFNEKLSSWMEPIRLNVYSNINPQKSKIIKKKHHCREAKEFMDFVHASGGHENGWHKDDHILFIKFRNKSKNIDILAQNLHEALPDISIMEIKRHEEWYKKYINLQKRKRDAIKVWQTEKNNKPTLKHSSGTSSEIKIVSEVEPVVNIQEKLIKWKIDREEKMKTVREIEFYKELKRNELEELRKKRNEEMKKMVQEWKQTKKIMEKQVLLEKKTVEEHDKKRRAKEANRMIKQFQSYDDIYIMKMRQQRKREVLPQVRSKSSHLVKRDPERVLKPTKQWINRVHDENYYSAELSAIMSLKCLPKLGIPEWRKKLD